MPRIYALVLLMLLVRAAAAPAQITTGTVAGTVKDPQGAVVPGATVTLVSETRGTSLGPVISNEAGDFVFVNIPADTYTIEIALSQFKSLRRTGVPVSAGDRVAVGTLTIEVGGAAETVDVRGEAPVIQANSGERSYTISTDSVENLPIANRSFTALATLAPGVNGLARIGGGGTTFVMMDGISAIDTGSNGAPILQMNVESIAEVKMLTSNYQAEYGRSSGLQITAVTKSGTNRFRGSLYDVERNSDWNSNSKVNKLNGDPKPVSKERDWGFSIGGPVGKPGGNNRLFFFYAQEFSPRTAGNDVVRFRVPTALERAGDFSETHRQSRQPVSVHQGPEPGRRLLGRQPGRLLRGRRSARQDSGEPPVSTRTEHAESVAAAEHRERARAGVQLRADAAERIDSELAAGGSRRLPADAEAACDVQVLGLAAAQPDHQRHAAGVQRHQDAAAGRLVLGDDGQLHVRPDDVPGSDLRPQPGRARGVPARPAVYGSDLLHIRHSDGPDVRSQERRPREPAAAVPRRERDQPELLRVRSAGNGEARTSGMGAGRGCRRSSRGETGSPTHRRASGSPAT